MRKIFIALFIAVAIASFFIALRVSAESTIPPSNGYSLNWYKDGGGKNYIYGTIPQASEAISFYYTSKSGTVYKFSGDKVGTTGDSYFLEVNNTSSTKNIATLKKISEINGRITSVKTDVPLTGTAAFSNFAVRPATGSGSGSTPGGGNGSTPGGSTGGTPLKTAPATTPANLSFSFDSMFGGTCSDYKCWIQKVWAWAVAVMVPLSIIVLIIAGALYATSAGSPDKISLSKKLIIGVLSGLALIVIARILLVNFIGLDSSVWNI